MNRTTKTLRVDDGGEFTLELSTQPTDAEVNEPLELVVIDGSDKPARVALSRDDATQLAKFIADELGYTLVTGPDDR